MKLGKAISWLLRNLDRSLFPQLEECWSIASTEKEQQLVSILELIQIEKYVPWSAINQWVGRKLCERESMARSFMASVYGFAFTRSLIEAPTTTPTLRQICGFEHFSDTPSRVYFFTGGPWSSSSLRPCTNLARGLSPL